MGATVPVDFAVAIGDGAGETLAVSWCGVSVDNGACEHAPKASNANKTRAKAAILVNFNVCIRVGIRAELSTVYAYKAAESWSLGQ